MKWLINPFERVAGWQALVIGLVVMSLTAIIGKINIVTFDGVLDVKSTTVTFSYSASFIVQLIIFLLLFLFMWLAGVCFSKSKIRALDIAGTMALARIPMLLFVIICFLPIIPESLVDFPRLIVFSIIGILFIIWMIALMYNAYSVSCHLKGQRAVLSFIGAVIVAELISKIIFFSLSGSLFANEPTKSSLNADTYESVVIIDSLTIQQKTENIARAFEHGDFDIIPLYFDKQMKKTLSPSKLKFGWMQASAQCGKFKNVDLENTKESVHENYDLVKVPFIFQKNVLILQIAFNKEGRISGLYFLPDK